MYGVAPTQQIAAGPHPADRCLAAHKIAPTPGRPACAAPQGYNYELQAPQPDGSTFVAATANLSGSSPAEAPVQLPGANWTVLIAPVAGWQPPWRAPMLVTVAVVGVLIGLLVCAIMVNRRQLMWLVAELRVGCPPPAVVPSQ